MMFCGGDHITVPSTVLLLILLNIEVTSLTPLPDHVRSNLQKKDKRSFHDFLCCHHIYATYLVLIINMKNDNATSNFVLPDYMYMYQDDSKNVQF